MNISNKLFSLSLLVTAMTGLLPVSSQAQQMPERGPIPFVVYDQDASGSISEQEFNAVRGQRMQSQAEAGRPMRGAANAPAFADMDKNADGQLSVEELFAGQRAQMQKRRDSMMQQNSAMGMGPGKGMQPAAGMGPGTGMGPGMGGRNMPAFPNMDKNQDGRVDEQELSEFRNARMAERAEQGLPMRNAANRPGFQAIDTDGDGNVSQQEFMQHQQQRRQQMMQQGGMGPGAMGPGSMGPSGMGPGSMGPGMMGRQMPMFSSMDLNGDGVIVEQELAEARSARINERAQQGYPMRNVSNAPSFAEIDTDGDGKITPREFSMHQMQRGGRGMQ